MLVQHGKVIPTALARELVTESELLYVLHRQGFSGLSEVEQCVLYQITVSNVGSSNATSVVVSDATPTYTTLNSAAATTVGSIGAGSPAVGGTGTVTANVGTLTPGQSALVTFGVKINP